MQTKHNYHLNRIKEQNHQFLSQIEVGVGNSLHARILGSLPCIHEQHRHRDDANSKPSELLSTKQDPPEGRCSTTRALIYCRCPGYWLPTPAAAVRASEPEHSPGRRYRTARHQSRTGP
eukprot:scaffold16628_cov48-Prasinocladus_malaysianus.AAC.1